MKEYQITFSDKICNRIEQDYAAAVEFFGERKEEIVSRVEALDEMEKLLMKYLYAYMPLSDVGAYSFDRIYSYASHGAMLLETSPFLKGVPEDYFFHYVLAHRINSEDITDCRKFFYDNVMDRVKGMTRKEAVLEANNWCYEQATYRSTSARTASPMTVYRGGFGRCGEESTFLTTVLRSLGIPARQIYVPRWSHSDDNHAWVEIYTEDGWFYTGACEPKPVLNNGWFTYAASRAMVVHSRLFCAFGNDNDEITERDGGAVLLNEGKRYALTVPFTVRVKDAEGKPVQGATVRFEIVNSAEFFPIATLKTDENGSCFITLGQGDVHLYVLYEGKAVSAFADVKANREFEVVFEEKAVEEDWVRYQLTAPESAVVSAVDMTAEQDAEQNKKNEKGDALRQGRQDSYFDAAYVESWKDYPNVVHTLEQAKGNFAEIKKFLETEYPLTGKKEKDMLLSVIALKDCRDITEPVLADALSALQYKDEYPEEVFVKALLKQGIHIEFPTAYRAYLRERFADRAEEFKADPMGLWNWLEKEIAYYPDREYTTIFSVPQSACEMKAATPVSRAILFVAILRTFGVPARFDHLYGEPQYYKDGAFHYVHEEFHTNGTLVLENHEEKTPGYYQQFTIGRKQADGSYETLELWRHEFENGKMELKLAPGEYRIVTCDRMSTGNTIGKLFYFTMAADETKELELVCAELRAEDLMTRAELPAFTVQDDAGNVVESAEICGEGRGVLIFGEPGKEPTEHVFNELLEISQMAGFPKCNLNLILKNKDTLEDPTLKKVRATYPDMKLWYADFAAILPEIEKNTKVTTKNLPYICVNEGSKESLYCCSGYNVGCVDVFARLIRG